LASVAVSQVTRPGGKANRGIGIFAADMGYGHLRAAMPLADELGVELLHADQAPFADARERWLWAAARAVQGLLSRPSHLPGRVGAWTRALHETMTMIPSLYRGEDLSAPDVGVRILDRMIGLGLGRGLVDHLQRTGDALLTTFYAPAIIADRAGVGRIYCVVTDADCHRVWAPFDGQRSAIQYFAPSPRVVRRLCAYGVPRERITLTGFPLPGELLGGPTLGALYSSLARRLVRLDPRRVFRELHGFDVSRAFPGGMPLAEEGRPPRLTFAVGGAGAQVDMAAAFLPSLRDAIRARRLELTLVAGVRSEVLRRFRQVVSQNALTDELGRGIQIVHQPTFDRYYREFNRVLERTDVLWTKPSELSFYTGLGLPLVVAPPVGAHERYNRRWLRDQGVALKQRNPRHAWQWLSEWLEDGTLAAAAWSGYVRLPKDGTYRIAEVVQEQGRSASTT
jgi:hypothetical protein